MYKIEKLQDKNYSIKLNVSFVKLRVGRTSNKHVIIFKLSIIALTIVLADPVCLVWGGRGADNWPTPLTYEQTFTNETRAAKHGDDLNEEDTE